MALLRMRGRTSLTPGKITLALVAFGYSLWAIYGVGREVVFWGFLLLVVGIPVYVWIKCDQAELVSGPAAIASDTAQTAHNRGRTAHAPGSRR